MRTNLVETNTFCVFSLIHRMCMTQVSSRSYVRITCTHNQQRCLFPLAKLLIYHGSQQDRVQKYFRVCSGEMLERITVRSIQKLKNQHVQLAELKYIYKPNVQQNQYKSFFLFVRRKTLIGYVNINLKPNSNVISSSTFLYSKLVSTIHESVKIDQKLSICRKPSLTRKGSEKYEKLRTKRGFRIGKELPGKQYLPRKGYYRGVKEQEASKQSDNRGKYKNSLYLQTKFDQKR